MRELGLLAAELAAGFATAAQLSRDTRIPGCSRRAVVGLKKGQIFLPSKQPFGPPPAPHAETTAFKPVHGMAPFAGLFPGGRVSANP